MKPTKSFGRRPWRAVDLEAVDRGGGIFEVGDTAEELPGVLGAAHEGGLEREVALAGDDELLFEIEGREPIIELDDLFTRTVLSKAPYVSHVRCRGHPLPA